MEAAGNGSPRSILSCEFCKSDRQLPTCSLCLLTAQSCIYPKARRKPGPKLGSTNRPRRREEKRIVRHDAGSRSFHEPEESLTSVGDAGPGDQGQRALAQEASPLGTFSVASTATSTFTRPDMMALNFAKAISLSAIFHPSHESPTSLQQQSKAETQPGFLLVMAGVQEKLNRTCEELRLNLEQVQSLIDLWFEAVAGLSHISLFHRPTFSDKVQKIADHNQLTALFAAMFSISSRFSPKVRETDPASRRPSHQEFHEISLTYIQKALQNCTNSSPDLCLLQAMALAGFYKLTQGVDGPAWRLVGSAVRIAYELRLHLIDFEGVSGPPLLEAEFRNWSLKEERRRCWWVVWELDTFASTIKRLPKAVDSKMIETYLPIPDELWFANKYQASCLLHDKPEEKWQQLKKSGNESSFAWCIVLDSLMREAQVLPHGNIQGIFSDLDSKNNIPELLQYFSHGYQRKHSEGNSQLLASLANALDDLLENLPTSLRHDGEALIFDKVEGDDELSARRLSAGKYSVVMLSVSVRWMLYQNYLFADIVNGAIPLPFHKPGAEASEQSVVPPQPGPRSASLKNFLKISEDVLRLLESCPRDHTQYVSPYYASTVWIAAALQIFRRRSVPDDNPTVTPRRYAALRQTYLDYALAWGTPQVLLQSLDSLETQLEARQHELEMSSLGQNALRSYDQQRLHDGNPENDGEARGAITSANRQEIWASSQEASLFDASQPFRDTREPVYNLWSGEVNTDWPTAENTDPAPPSNQSDFPPILPDDVFLQNLAWFSSDMITGLYQHYTS